MVRLLRWEINKIIGSRRVKVKTWSAFVVLLQNLRLTMSHIIKKVKLVGVHFTFFFFLLVVVYTFSGYVQGMSMDT